jgi:transcriptional antiterminator RfaH
MDFDALPDSQFWNLAICQPGQDRLACKALKTRGYIVYRPIMPRVTCRWGREAEDENGRSMFPGYLFVQPNNSGGWESLRTTPGMAYGDRALHRVNGRVATIPHDDPMHVGIAQIRKLEESLWTTDMNGNHTKSRFNPGDRVEVRKGPWVEFCGVIERLDGPTRCSILIQMLGGLRRAYVNPAHLVHASA